MPATASSLPGGGLEAHSSPPRSRPPPFPPLPLAPLPHARPPALPPPPQLSVADVVLVNMWAKDVGRESGAGKPLLKTIFQVNLKLFAPTPGARRTVLLFVFRDRTKTPLDKLVGGGARKGGLGRERPLQAVAPGQRRAARRSSRCADAPRCAACRPPADRDVGGGPPAHVGGHHQAPPV